MNFTSNFLGHLKIKILDENEIEISTIKKDFNQPKFFYSKPFIFYDRLAEEKKVLEPKIEIISLNDLMRLGYIVISVPITSETKWRPFQKTALKITQKNNIQFGVKILKRFPEHKIEFDSANKLVRLIGKNAGKDGASGWSEI